MKKPYKEMTYHPMSEKLVSILQAKAQNSNPLFFRVVTAFYLGLVAAHMRASIKGWVGKDNIPINVYSLALSPSGTGKGLSTTTIENEVLGQFKEVFLERTFPICSDMSLEQLAVKRANRSGTAMEDELAKVQKDFIGLGSLLFSFDSATSPAIKQMRQKLLMANCGAANLIVDECYTPDVSVLTENGFVPFSNLSKDVLIAQFDTTTESLSFVKPLRYIEKDYSGQVANFKSATGFDFTVTPNHQLLIYSPYKSDKGFIKLKPSEVSTGHFIQCTGKHVVKTNFTLTDDLRLKLAVQADGCIRPYGNVEIALKKQRKIDELNALIERLGIRCNSYKWANGYTVFSIPKETAESFNFSKDLRDILPNLPCLDFNSCRDILSELVKWDGSINAKLSNIQRFTCKHLHNVEYVHAIAVLAGYRSKLYANPKEHYEGGYYVSWDVTGKSKSNLAYLNKPSKTHDQYRTYSNYEGKVYCVEVPTGAIVIRRNGVVSINGNCGANLASSVEPLTTYLELYDKGLVKEKLTKSTSDNVRFEKLSGATPSNLLMFGTPSKVFDGGTTESLLFELLEMGYARRCFFGFAKASTKIKNQDAKVVMAQLFAQEHNSYLEHLADKFGMLADAVNINKVILLPEASIEYLIEYRMDCEARSEQLLETANLAKSELDHRYFKVLKLAGAYAFVDGSPEITIDHLEYAIKLAEDSGEAFNQLLTPERPYTKLAKYLASTKADSTLADLDEDLPYFKGSKTNKEEMILMATAWGYKNNIIIKKIFTDGIMFLRGETIEQTDTSKMLLSYSGDMTTGYVNAKVPFEKLNKLFQLDDHHWINHQLIDGDTGNGYRDTRNCIAGTNLLVLDIDGTTNLSTAKLLLKGYKAWYYTTKRHTETEHRFRIVLPMNYTLKLDVNEYKEFINNVIQSLPFDVDTSCNQQAKKWLTHKGHIEYTEGDLFDVLPFIPKTSKNDERQALLQSQQSMDNLERWVLNNIAEGNRSNMLIRYSLILVDAGFGFDAIKTKVLDLNSKLPDKLDEVEILTTILKTTATALAKRGNP